MRDERIIYYTDEQNDDFAGTKIRKRPVGRSFPFLHRSVLWNGLAFIVYYIIAVPIVFLVCKLYLGLKFENRRVLRALRHTGYYLYGNHTRVLDAFMPAMAAFPKRAYIVADPDAVSLPLLRNIVQMLGAIPIPTEFSGMRGFLETVTTRCAQGRCVAVYPEAHIWPFYTGIRPFPDTSFRYPVKDNAPAVAMVTTYRKRRGLFRLAKHPGMTITFSEPMYPAQDLPPKAAQRDLRDRAYVFMAEIAASRENIAYIRYEHKATNGSAP